MTESVRAVVHVVNPSTGKPWTREEAEYAGFVWVDPIASESPGDALPVDQRPSKLEVLREMHRHYSDRVRSPNHFSSGEAWGRAVQDAHRALLTALDEYMRELP